MINIAEYRRKPDRLTDRLPWAAMIRPGLILNKDGSLQRTFAYRGPDLASSTPGELGVFAAQQNNILKRLTSGWAIYAEAQRVESLHYPEATFPEMLPQLIDEQRRDRFESGIHFETRYYLTVVYLPPPDTEGKIKRMFVKSAAPHTAVDHYQQELRLFEDRSAQIGSQLAAMFPHFEQLTDDETLTYLHSAVSPKAQTVVCPDVPMYLDAIVSDSALVGGFEPRLGDCHIGVISLTSFPGSTYPGLLSDLDLFDFSYRWSSRWIAIDKKDALDEIQSYSTKWFGKRKSMMTHFKEYLTSSESIMTDGDAVSKAEDAMGAMAELADDLVSYGYYTSAVIILDTDRERLGRKLLAIENAITGRGLTCIRESMNAVEAFLGAVPGNCRANIRRPLLSSFNIAHMIPATAIWAGPVENSYLRHKTGVGAPLMYTQTMGSTPFRLMLHVSDVGHTMIVGPTGAGKSVLLSMLMAQFLRYPNAQVFAFDKGYSAAAMTAGLGGTHYDIGGDSGENLAFQPLRDIDSESGRRWAFGWLCAILSAEQLQCDSEIKQHAWAALCSLASAPQEQRTLTGFSVLVQNTRIRDVLKPFSISGPYGNLLDAHSDDLAFGRVQCFEMEHLMDMPQVVPHVLDYLFHRIEQRLSSDIPTLIILDEAWRYLDSPVFAGRLRQWLKELRRSNASLIFASQSLNDVEQSSITSALVESCPTRIFLPNTEANQDNIAPFYRRFGLNDRELDIVSHATKKRDYYYKSPLGCRLFTLDLDKLALAYCGAERDECEKVVPQLRAAHGAAGFNSAWLRYKGLAHMAERFGVESRSERNADSSGGKKQT